jgi:uncharacterized membrane protein
VKKYLTSSLIVLGILDTLYLTWEHFTNITPPCPAHSFFGSFVDCGKVLHSQYATIFGIPLSLFGLGYFVTLLLTPKLRKYLVIFGLGFSIYLLGLQIFVLHAICLYCTFSGLLNLLIFIVTWSSRLSLTLKPKNSSTK